MGRPFSILFETSEGPQVVIPYEGTVFEDAGVGMVYASRDGKSWILKIKFEDLLMRIGMVIPPPPTYPARPPEIKC